MSDAPDGLTLAGIVGGALSAITAIGAGISWLFTRKDRREAALERKEEALVAKLEATVKEQGARIEALEKDNRKIWLALSYVVPALYAHDQDSPALKAAAMILGDALPIPVDMIATLNKIS